MQLSLDDFKNCIRNSRSRESSGDPESRSDQNPSYRQCLATALLANEFLGLSVFAEKINGENHRTGYHFFNKNTENIPICFCEEQFAYEKILARKKERPLHKDQIDVLLERHPEVNQRYEILKEKFQEQLVSLIR